LRSAPVVIEAEAGIGDADGAGRSDGTPGSAERRLPPAGLAGLATTGLAGPPPAGLAAFPFRARPLRASRGGAPRASRVFLILDLLVDLPWTLRCLTRRLSIGSTRRNGRNCSHSRRSGNCRSLDRPPRRSGGAAGALRPGRPGPPRIQRRRFLKHLPPAGKPRAHCRSRSPAGARAAG